MKILRFKKSHYKRYILIITGIIAVSSLGVYASPAKQVPVKHIVHSKHHVASNNSDNSSPSPTLQGESGSTSSSPDNSTSDPSTYTNDAGNTVESPDYNINGATALCNDGTFSHSQSSSGTCSDHGGVMNWLNASANTPAPTAPTPVCTSSTIQAEIDAENSRHDSAISDIQAQYSQQLGGMGSGMEANSINQENQQHQQNLAPLQSQLSAASC